MVRAYMKEAIALGNKSRQTGGIEEDRRLPDMPEELEAYLKEDAELAFKALTPGRQRGYLLHIGGAKKRRPAWRGSRSAGTGYGGQRGGMSGRRTSASFDTLFAWVAHPAPMYVPFHKADMLRQVLSALARWTVRLAGLWRPCLDP